MEAEEAVVWFHRCGKAFLVKCEGDFGRQKMLQGDVELRSNVSIQISIEDYAESLTKIGMDRNRKKTEELSREEMFAVTKIMVSQEQFG